MLIDNNMVSKTTYNIYTPPLGLVTKDSSPSAAPLLTGDESRGPISVPGDDGSILRLREGGDESSLRFEAFAGVLLALDLVAGRNIDKLYYSKIFEKT